MAKKPTLHSYFGGKTKIGDWLKDFIPNNYNTYLEPFSGSYAIYFLTNTPETSKVRYNDINRDQANLVACSKDYEVFHDFLKNEIDDVNGCLYCKETDATLIKTHYKELYYSLKKSNFRNEQFNIPDMKRASQYAFLLTSAFSSCSYTAAGFSGFKLKTYLNKLKNVELQKKLTNIDTFETLDFEQVINKYDSDDTFIYLDPPYNTVEKKGSNDDARSGWYGTKDEFGQSDHTKLLELLKTTKSRWALSYYYFDELEDMMPKNEYVWLQKDFFRSSASFSETKETKGTELLILNYDPKTFIKFPDGYIIVPKNEEISDDLIIDESIAPEVVEKVEKQKIEIVESKEEIKEEIKVESEDYWNS